jgi:outer membrane immunogenic protein
MSFVKVCLAALVAISFGVGSAAAADLPTRKEAPSFLTPTPVYSWGGAYIGINGGYGFGNQNPLAVITSRFDNASFNINGGAFGITSGMQIQQGHVVLGVESDLDWANVKGSRSFTPTIAGVAQPFALTLNSQIDWMSTGRVRYGYAQDNWLFFGTAGLALMGSKPHINSITDRNGVVLNCANVAVNIPNCSTSGVAGGLAFGGGIEYGFTPNWSAKAEYLYIAQLQGANTQNLNLFRVGLNYRFGG